MKNNYTLAYELPGSSEKTRFEKIHNLWFQEALSASKAVAAEIAEAIKAAKKPFVLGLATGSSPIEIYRELVRLHQHEGLSFKNVISFNLDEYLGLSPKLH